MKKLYIVFDQVPSKFSGGLITTYLNLVDMLKNDYDIHIISIFNCDDDNKELFADYPVHIIYNYNIDNRFFRMFSYLFIQKNFKKFIKSIKSAYLYFFSKRIIKKRVLNTLNVEDKVIVSSPSAAAFMPENIEFILEIHTKYEYFFGKNILGKLQGALMTRPKLILFRSQIDAKKAKEKFNAGFIYNTVNVEKNSEKKDISLIKNKVLFVGRLSAEKNLPKMLKIINSIKKDIPDIVLDIYGTGEMESFLKNEIKKMNLENNVFFKGFTTNKKVYYDYSLLILTSDVEGFPLTIIEAKANGTPTVTSKWGEAVYETVKDGVDGFVCDCEEDMVQKIKEVLKNNDLLKFLSKNSLASFDEFSRENTRKKWLEILK